MSRPPISAYIMTFNEAEKIVDAIASVRWADEVVVIDSFSTDGTDRIAEEMGARVESVPFHTFGQIRNTAMDACRHDWIFSLDADERCTRSAAEEIQRTVDLPDAVDAYFIPRRNWYLGRWVMHSGWYPDYRQPQLFRRGALAFDSQAEVHEEYTIQGTVGYLTQDIIQFPYMNIEQMVHKMQRYSTLGAEKCDRQGKQGGIGKGLLHGLWSFFRHYVIKLGFLDGRAGLMIAVGNFEGTFYRYAKLAARQQNWLKKPPSHP
ncbi:MAG: glycosyltransferase family 2 protein [Mariprofundales bacterium]|nr:glycosyltransferase family 2 protein [Mariprofundales bacterium]